MSTTWALEKRRTDLDGSGSCESLEVCKAVHPCYEAFKQDSLGRYIILSHGL